MLELPLMDGHKTKLNIEVISVTLVKGKCIGLRSVGKSSTFLIFPKISVIFLIFRYNFPHFCPPGG